MTGYADHVIALMQKDARLHGRAIASAQAAVLGIAALAWTLKPDADAANTTLLFNFNVLLAGFWGEWLISREKTKGTFAWLRATTVTDAELVLSKFLAAGLCTTTLWVATAVVFVRPGRLEAVAVWAGLLTFSALAVACRWRFEAKMGQVLPYVALLVPLTVMIAVTRVTGLEIDPGGWLDTPIRHVAAIAFFTCCWLALFDIVRRWVRRCDTYQLLE